MARAALLVHVEPPINALNFVQKSSKHRLHIKPSSLIHPLHLEMLYPSCGFVDVVLKESASPTQLQDMRLQTLGETTPRTTRPAATDESAREDNKTWTPHTGITAVAVNIAIVLMGRARPEAVDFIRDPDARKASRGHPKEAAKA